MQTQYTAFALTPLAEQPTRNLVVLLFCAAIGLRLRSELRVTGLSDADVIRREIRCREWGIRR